MRKPVLIVAISILCMALAVRLAMMTAILLHDPNQFIVNDTPSYWQPALALLNQHQFLSAPQAGAAPEVLRTPGYPLFLAASFLLFGESVNAIIALQFVMNLAAIACVGWLGSRLWGGRAALIAMALFAFDLTTLEAANRVLSESLFTLLLCGVLACGCQAIANTKRPARWALACALGIVALSMARPIGFLLGIPVGAWLLWAHWRLGARPRFLARLAALFFLPLAAGIGGWMARNHHAAGTWQFSTIGQINLGLYRAAGILVHDEGLDYAQAQTKIRAMAGLKPSDPMNAANAAKLAATAKQFIMQRRATALLTSLKGALIGFWGPNGRGVRQMIVSGPAAGGPVSDLRHGGPALFFKNWVLDQPFWLFLFVFELGLLALQYAGFWLGAGLSLKADKPRFYARGLLFLVFLYFWALSAEPEAYSRFRVPVVPILALFAGGGWSWLLRRFQPSPGPAPHEPTQTGQSPLPGARKRGRRRAAQA